MSPSTELSATPFHQHTGLLFYPRGTGAPTVATSTSAATVASTCATTRTATVHYQAAISSTTISTTVTSNAHLYNTPNLEATTIITLAGVRSALPPIAKRAARDRRRNPSPYRSQSPFRRAFPTTAALAQEWWSISSGPWASTRATTDRPFFAVLGTAAVATTVELGKRKDIGSNFGSPFSRATLGLGSVGMN